MKRLSFVLLLSLCATIPAQPVSTNQPETIVRICEGFEPTVLNYGERTEAAAINFAYDIDTFRFIADGGEQISILVDGTSNGLGLSVSLRDQLGVPVALVNNNCSSPWNGTCSIFASLATSATLVPGSHVLSVAGGGAATGTYTLQLERTGPSVAPPFLAIGASVTDVLQSTTDQDWYRVWATGGETLVLSVVSLTNDLDPTVDVWTPTGAYVGAAFCYSPWNGGCSGQLTMTNMVPGPHLVRVSEVGVDNAGTFQLTLTCQFSPQPSGQCTSYPWFPCGSSPAITSISPPVLPAQGGIRVRVFGSGFCGNQGLIGLILAGTSIVHQHVSFISPTELAFVMPPVAAGAQFLTVTNPGVPPVSATFSVSVRETALTGSPLQAGTFNVLELRSPSPSAAPVFVLVDVALGPRSLGSFGVSALAWSPLMFALADPLGLFGAPISCPGLDSEGKWRLSGWIDPNVSGVTIHLEGLILDSAVPSGLRISNAVSATL